MPTDCGTRGEDVEDQPAAGGGRLSQIARLLVKLGVSALVKQSDTELLTATRQGDAEAFGQLFRRRESLVLAFLARRVRDPEAAADLCAETFAAALLAGHQQDFDAPRVPAAWLLTIARNKLTDAYRRGQVEDAARRNAGMAPLAVSDADLERIDALTEEAEVLRMLEALPGDQQVAVRARVLDDMDYAEIAAELRISESVVRQRVSRGLRRLRHALETR